MVFSVVSAFDSLHSCTAAQHGAHLLDYRSSAGCPVPSQPVRDSSFHSSPPEAVGPRLAELVLRFTGPLFSTCFLIRTVFNGKTTTTFLCPLKHDTGLRQQRTPRRGREKGKRARTSGLEALEEFRIESCVRMHAIRSGSAARLSSMSSRRGGVCRSKFRGMSPRTIGTSAAVDGVAVTRGVVFPRSS